MDAHVNDVVREMSEASDEERITFPEVVKALMEVGIERYHADLLVPLHRGLDGFKLNGGLGGPRARPESQCCARRPGSA
jgi:hypothetical protein